MIIQIRNNTNKATEDIIDQTIKIKETITIEETNIRIGTKPITRIRIKTKDLENNQQFKQNFQWSEDGRPICNQCKQSGHMMRECPKNEQNQEN